MADTEDDNSALASFFPDPPLFWKAFTPSNLQAYAEIKQQYASQHGIPVEDVIRVPDLPADSDLIYLQPPAEPKDGTWRLYGEPQSLEESLQPLESAGIERLGPPLPGSTTTSDTQTTTDSQSTTQPTTDDTQPTSQLPLPPPSTSITAPATSSGAPSTQTHDTLHLHLKRLSKSLLLNFLELLGIMSLDPAAGSQKAADLRTLFLNFHHVLNEYRPHQAREQLIQLMQERLDQTRAETAANRAVAEKARRVLEGLGSVEIPAVDVNVAGAGVGDGDGGYGSAAVPVPVGARTGTTVGDRRVGVDGEGAEEEERRYWEREGMGWGVLDAEFA
ncbi:mediator of RNA polymerase II transcription subunit 7 [Neurospora hispaniola]|uniref:Mediator of RNA polymerase II transcription subunit 7 n=1 Tax=Neurospora hispaniola TaxID=588809 RepID=A0AAJ0MR26_9PEZI|nr:mediator of RNA polymerase II transcription subunit 7 [Neurospora hispaniola]